MEEIKIFFSGDFAPRLRVKDFILKGEFQKLYNGMLPFIQEADYSITNLECPLIETGSPIVKTGPALRAPIQSIEAIKFAGFNMVTFANNHARDYGDEGIVSTLNACSSNGVVVVGAGRNYEEAKSIQYISIKGKKISFINCCENEWSTTWDDTPGCNPLDEIGLFYQINEARGNSDFVILMIHGGHETYELPSPRMVKLYRWFVDLGVDAVIGNHTHCFSGYEVYKGKPIFYSLGNFLFDSKRNQSWNYGAAVILKISEEQIGFDIIPYEQCNSAAGIFPIDGEKKKHWLLKEREKSEIIRNSEQLCAEFEVFATRQSDMYKQFLDQDNRFLAFLKRKHIIRYNIDGVKRKLYLNLIRNEAHRNIILKLLNF